MMQSKYETLPFLPETRFRELAKGITILNPLSRRGVGPGVIVLVSDSGVLNGSSLRIERGVPSPLMKWAEEGYTVVELTEIALETMPDALETAVIELARIDTTQPKDVVGLVAYNQKLWNSVASSLDHFPQIVGAVVYDAVTQSKPNLSPATIPQVHHLAGALSELPIRTKKLMQYDYPGTVSSSFATPFHDHFDYSAESVSYSRNLTFLKQLMGGPFFDLEAIWEEHTYYEFENRSVECTMGTMVQEPYVNHIPTLTGGIGREQLTAFYRDHFIFKNPEDVVQELISRSIGIDRVVDEFIFKCTHNSEIDWLLPGVPPTSRKLEIPFVAVVNIRGDRLYHEHITWDQATVLKQLGLLPEYLPYPYQIAKGTPTVAHERLEYCVPAGGVETATKLRDKDSLSSNQMLSWKIRTV